MEVTKKIEEEYVVATDLGSYTDLIETGYKYRLLRDTLINSLKYCKYMQNKVEIDVDKVVPILNAIEPVAYRSVVNQLLEKNETNVQAPKMEVLESEATIELSEDK